MSTNRMMSVRSLFLRLNHDRTSKKASDNLGRNDLWLIEGQLMGGSEKFLKLNGYQKIEFNQTFKQGGFQFTSPIVGYRNSSQDHLNETVSQGQEKDHARVQNQEGELMEGERKSSGVFEMDNSKITTTVCIINPKIQDYDLSFFGHIESILYDIIDSYENTNLILVTDSLSYLSATTKEEINVTLENLMEEGMHLLFINEKSDYAFFEKYGDIMEKPITVYGV
ncbi:MAG: hypothetical protein ACRD8Z_08795 [Nitrososphaeraceae archaeon]